MAGVIAAIRYPAYSGVMAATGLSYLALLTTLGAVFVGRAIAAGLDGIRNRTVAAAVAAVEPPTDIHAPGDYRRALLAVLLERALARASGVKLAESA